MPTPRRKPQRRGFVNGPKPQFPDPTDSATPTGTIPHNPLPPQRDPRPPYDPTLPFASPLYQPVQPVSGAHDLVNDAIRRLQHAMGIQNNEQANPLQRYLQMRQANQMGNGRGFRGY